jgi:Tfp pilus assembly protein PilV
MLSINHRATAAKAALAASGFTLAEALLAVVVLMVAVAGIMGPISASYSQTRTVKQTTTAISMAQQLLDEILSKPFVDPSDLSTALGPEANELGRAAFDNIDDYHGYNDSTDSTKVNAMKTASGQAILWNSNDNYTRAVTMEYRNSPTGASVAGGDYLLITVKVTMPHGHQVSVERMVCLYPKGT